MVSLRLLSDVPEVYDLAEQDRLRARIAGVVNVRSIERHPKGGYSVVVERLDDALIEYLNAHGYRLVI
jgi:hypothetical protein